MTYTQAKQLIRHWRRQMNMECNNTPFAIRTIVRLTARAEAAEKYRGEWQATAQAYGNYRQRCAETGEVAFDFWDWGMKEIS